MVELSVEAFGSFEFDSPFDPFAIDFAEKKNPLDYSEDFRRKPMRLYVTYLPFSFHIKVVIEVSLIK